MRVAIVGGRSFARAVYRRLKEDGHEVRGVWTDDQDFTDLADVEGVPWLWQEAPAPWALKESGAEVLVSAHNHTLIPPELLSVLERGTIGYHPSLLPRHRGRDAVQWTIEMGDPIAGGSVYYLDGGVDTGPVLLQEWCHVAPEWTASDLWRERLFPMGLELLSTALNLHQLLPEASVQDERFATHEPPWVKPVLR